MKLLVYGTLQQGYWNNRLLHGAKFLGPALTEKKYVLFNCGFPKAVPFSVNEEKYPLLQVRGEVYEVEEDHVKMCDRLEGHPSWYHRSPIQAKMMSGEKVDVNIYEMPEWQDTKVCHIVDNIYYQWVG
jgi:gamma-glutamylcyclotransferase (GGCT)/AIG2-like uncharacterized protein YtfP